MGAYEKKKNYLPKENFPVGKRGLTKTADRLKKIVLESDKESSAFACSVNLKFSIYRKPRVFALDHVLRLWPAVIYL